MSDMRTTASITPSPTGGHPAAEDLVLFAMQLLRPEQRVSVQEHVDRCAVCREELGKIHADFALVALSSDPVSPTAEARNRLLAQVVREKKLISSTPPLPSEPPSPAPAPSTRPLADFGRGRGSTLVADTEIARSRTSGVFGWAGWVVAGGLAVVSLFLYKDHRAMVETLATQTGEAQRLHARAADSHRLMDALTDPQAVRVMLAPRATPKGPVGGVTYNADEGSLVFLASNLDPLQRYKTYELWVIPADKSAPIPAGTFHPDERGNASVIMPSLPKGVKAKAFGVTIEDAGGAEKPTMPIIMAGS